MWANSLVVRGISLGLSLGVGLGVALRPLPGLAEEPMSAIDWLSQSVSLPVSGPVSVPVAMPVVPAPPTEAPVVQGALPENITVQSIDGPSQDAIGLLPVSVTGLPRDLWAGSQTDRLVSLIAADQSDSLPGLRSLLLTLLLAEATPPADSDDRGLLFLARVDRLLDIGALDQARALLDQSGVDQPQVFRRWFDVSLLLGDEDRACTTMRALPSLAPTFPARIFCLARGGDWNAAALTLQTGRALGFVTAEEDALLSHFLDPELFEGEPPLPTPQRPSPLIWRIMEAIGEPMATNALPLAFAQGDLRPTTGWKGQIEAAERLTRSGALPPNRLLGLYTERKPAASGGVWDRAAAVQAFDAAYAARDLDAVARSLPIVWATMVAAELEVPFAALFGEGLAGMQLKGSAGALAFRVALLSPAAESVAQARRPDTSDEAFLAGIARGDLQGTTPPDGLGAAVRDGLTTHPVPQDLADLLAARQVGEAILLASARIGDGLTGDLSRISDGLATLRALGMESAARRIALELMLLERRG